MGRFTSSFLLGLMVGALAMGLVGGVRLELDARRRSHAEEQKLLGDQNDCFRDAMVGGALPRACRALIRDQL
ncbi:MAG: hypothetical protein ERJ67_09485 [Aphanocapsa feldmannii 277cV]|uniref:Uncharacterized protein n=1 Tax=Aphanocapsa feldmannii 277cV TaxID=2507553 RepID=A0A524RLH4_9CHRO|nr:MAG: hypothetical protein ERJ69_04420 [Aphanocapsa feldmannii 288cV]TGG90924.1 MAG: hypothetical protein ERJ67_09485 [Aphanocapsa feldmannii 277cV]